MKNEATTPVVKSAVPRKTERQARKSFVNLLRMLLLILW